MGRAWRFRRPRVDRVTEATEFETTDACRRSRRRTPLAAERRALSRAGALRLRYWTEDDRLYAPQARAGVRGGCDSASQHRQQ
eukprot:1239013-Pyramimonas_sp.AAC.1